MPTSVSLTISSLTCAHCSAAVDLAAFKLSKGHCSCGASSFDIVLTARRTSTPDPEPLDAVAAGAMVAGALVGVHVIHTERLGEIMGQYAVSDRDYEMQGLPGQAVLELLDLPAQDAIKWLTAMRKEMAKMNLQPHQALCLECGEIYAKSLAGPSAEGFCSRLCRNVHAKKSAPPPAPAVKGPREEPVKVTCPKCNRPVKIGRTASGKPRKCVWCGEPLAPPA